MGCSLIKTGWKRFRLELGNMDGMRFETSQWSSCGWKGWSHGQKVQVNFWFHLLHPVCAELILTGASLIKLTSSFKLCNFLLHKYSFFVKVTSRQCFKNDFDQIFTLRNTFSLADLLVDSWERWIWTGATLLGHPVSQWASSSVKQIKPVRRLNLMRGTRV